ncbi:MAG: carboxy-S-adenosyl-L-methionine synthase CmoA [Pseudomonadales bacterium]|nr:carboxy-S-adenosyl-L-methionine synthase CmoA [Pseudomonadales bacterium]
MPHDTDSEHNPAMKDNIFQQPLNKVSDFVFDQSVVRVFPDMIKRSVPGYATIIQMIGILTEQFAQADSTCYDLGCSLGAASLAMREHIHVPGCDIIAIDNSEPMVTDCRENLKKTPSQVEVDVRCTNIEELDIQNASIVVLNFTLQFIAPEQRQNIIETIYKGMLPGGLLILSEKIAFEDPQQEKLNVHMHHTFKRSNGYSELEVSQKRSALDNVLSPEPLKIHQQRIISAGFSSCDVWFQCFNFASMLVLK